MVYLDIPILNDLLDDFTGSQTRVLSDFLESNVDVYETPRPVFRTYYVDDDMRISRNQDDEIFIYTKVN